MQGTEVNTTIGAAGETESRQSLRASGRRQLIRGTVGALLHSLILFTAAGRMDLPRAWLYFGLTVGAFLLLATCLVAVAPELINQRGEKKQGTKWWDHVVLATFVPLLFLIPVIAGLDVGRFHWSPLGVGFAYAGTVVFLLGQGLVCWAMAVNVHFEPTVRIQTERDHQVVTSGPYSIVRHPGYVAVILSIISGPCIIGSGAAMIPASILVVLFVVRTALEDRTLQRELAGYPEYARRVRYRLLPFVW
jgi:protein-S-isoprenylcysteine O-methyltransferase Ste14